MKNKKEMRRKRKLRIRARVIGTSLRPRLSIFRSNQVLSVQIIDDEKRITLVSGSLRGKNKDVAHKLGLEIAQKAKEKKIDTVVFDRSGYRYHGAVESFAQAAREGGLKF